MSKNRPKIWLNDTTYIYRSEYNSHIKNQIWYPDALGSCRKFVTKCQTNVGELKKGDDIIVKLYGGEDYAHRTNWMWISGNITRIDYNYDNVPDELQIKSYNGALYSFHFRTKDRIMAVNNITKEQDD